MIELRYTGRRTGYEAQLEVDGVTVVEAVESGEGAVISGHDDYIGNAALVGSFVGYADNELAARRTSSPEKRESHRKESAAKAKLARRVATRIGQLSDVTEQGWCSGCFEFTMHRRRRGVRVLQEFLCSHCGTPTVECPVPRCKNFALELPGRPVDYCAPHRHEIPSFEKLNAHIPTLAEAADWLDFDHVNASRVTLVAGGVVGAAAVLGPLALMAAPAIGGAIGTTVLGLQGAAAGSAGLAALGGGSVAAGGFGMLGGTVVVTATGTALGGILGATATTAYVGADKSFRIEKLREGHGPAVVFATGFLTEGQDGWAGWKKTIDQKYPESPVYRVHWGAKELVGLGVLAAHGLGKQGARMAVVKLAKGASKKAGIPGLGWVLGARDIAVNPWSVAVNRATMTGAILADLIARADEGPYILMGHSLGGRVMVNAAQALGTRTGTAPKIEEMHLFGAAVNTKADWQSLHRAVRGMVRNYHSTDDHVLKWLYSTAQLGSSAVGHSGFTSKWPNIKDHNVTTKVHGHSDYLANVSLR
ncbi:DUF726 domain-containing protein [Nocardioides ultimimeridianus]